MKVLFFTLSIKTGFTSVKHSILMSKIQIFFMTPVKWIFLTLRYKINVD